MIVELECTYCGRKWELNAENKFQIENSRCKCGESALKVRDASKSKIDYYQGSPPFPEKKKDNPYDPYDYGSSD